MASLREQFKKSYAETALQQLDETLNGFATGLAKEIKSIINAEQKKDLATSKPHDGLITAGRISSKIDPQRIFALAGFKALRSACADEKIDVKISIIAPKPMPPVGFKTGEQEYKIVINLNEPHHDQAAAQQQTAVPEKKSIGFVIPEQKAPAKMKIVARSN